MEQSSSESVQIITIDFDSGQMKLNDGFLESLLNDPQIANKKICIISIVGMFRKGKSFMLNMFLLYMRWHQARQNGTDQDARRLDWLEWAFLPGKKRGNLFNWEGGRKPVTIGIHIWPEAFLIRDSRGEEKVVFLMDTQGLFDNVLDMNGNTAIFNMSSMLASVQIMNMHRQLEGNQLQKMAFFVEYGRMVASMTGGNSKPFQTLLYLIRDWPNPQTHQGYAGGHAYLQGFFRDLQQNANQMAGFGQNIPLVYEQMKCFLMDPPGEIIRMGQFKGEKCRVESMNEKFIESLKEFVPSVVAPDNLVHKTFNGHTVTCMEWFWFLRSYAKEFANSVKDMKPENAVLASARAEHLNALLSAEQLYQSEMRKLIAARVYSDYEFEQLHQRTLQKAIGHYKASKKIELDEALARQHNITVEQVLVELRNDVQMYFCIYRRQNALGQQCQAVEEEARHAKEAADRAQQELSIKMQEAEAAKRARILAEENLEKDQTRWKAEREEWKRKQKIADEKAEKERKKLEADKAEADRILKIKLAAAKEIQRKMKEQQDRFEKEQREIADQIRRKKNSWSCSLL